MPAMTDSAGTIMTSLCAAVCEERISWSLTGFLEDLHGDHGKRSFSVQHNHKDLTKVIKAITLKSLLSSQEQSHSAEQHNLYLDLPAKQRYGIAASIAWSVLHLRGSPWFGDHWYQEQVSMFLERSQSSREMLSQHPCASYTFSKQVSLEEPRTDDMKDQFPNIAVFALGIILIELCINRPIASIRRADEDTTPLSLLDDYKTALSSLDEVYRLAGDSYGYAAERCVKFSFEGRNQHNDFDFLRFRQQFYGTVVAPVQATYLMLSHSYYPN
jgi:hypothetical protein